MDNKKIQILIGVAVVLLLGGGFLLGRRGKKDDTIQREGTEIGSDTRPTDGSTKGSFSTITDTQAKTIARTMFNAMDRFGTDEDALFAAVNGLNGASLQKVYKAFGKPQYFLGESAAIFGDKMTLTEWMEAELGGNDLERMKAIWRKSNLGWQ
jgi:hypothetical protein